MKKKQTVHIILSWSNTGDNFKLIQFSRAIIILIQSVFVFYSFSYSYNYNTHIWKVACI